MFNYAIQTMEPKCVRDVLKVDREGVLLRRTFRVVETGGTTRELTPFQQVDSMRNSTREKQDEFRNLMENALHSIVNVEKEEEAKKAGVKKGGGGKAQGTTVQGTCKRTRQDPEAVEATRRSSMCPKREVSTRTAAGGGGGGDEGGGATAAVKGRRVAQGTKKGKALKSDSQADEKAGGGGDVDKEAGGGWGAGDKEGGWGWGRRQGGGWWWGAGDEEGFRVHFIMKQSREVESGSRRRPRSRYGDGVSVVLSEGGKG